MGLGEAALDGGLHEPVADHAVADDDEPAAVLGTHVRVPSRVGTVRWARSWRTVSAQPPQPVVARVRSRTSAREAQARTAPALTPAHAQTSASSGTDVGGGRPVGHEQGAGLRGAEDRAPVEVLGDQADPGQVADQGRGDQTPSRTTSLRCEPTTGLDTSTTWPSACSGSPSTATSRPVAWSRATVRLPSYVAGLAVEDPGEHPGLLPGGRHEAR